MDILNKTLILGKEEMKQHWLLKSEPTNYSIFDLQNEKTQTTFWSGVRNHQARNFLRDSIKIGDEAFFYHSNAKPSSIMGLVKVVKNAYPDPTQFDPKSKYFDPRATPQKPIWFVVDVQLKSMFKNPLSIQHLKSLPQLSGMMLLKQGSRLSVQPVSKEHFDFILNHSKQHLNSQ